MSKTETAREGDGSLSSPVWWANCYKVGQFIFALVDQGLWQRLGSEPISPKDLAEGAALDPKRLASALDLLHRFGLIQRHGGLYSLPSASLATEPLLKLEASLQRELISSDRVAAWLAGVPTCDPLDQQPSRATVDLFLNGFEVFGKNVALHIWRLAKMADRRKLLDLGGAAGRHAAEFSRLSRGMAFTIVDREIMRRPFERRRSELGLAERMSFVAGDLRKPQTFAHLIADHDAILISNVLHLLPPGVRDDTCRAILHRMRPGTRLVVHDLFMGTDDWQIAGFMTVDWMLLGADFSMTVDDCAEWLKALGFQILAARGLPGLPSGLVVAETPREKVL